MVLQLLLPAPALRTAAEAGLLAFIVLAIPRASRHIQYLCAAVFALGGWLLWRDGDWAALRRGLDAGLVFGAFVPTIMLLRATADASPLLDSTRERLSAWSEGQRCVWVQAATHLLGAIVMIGAYVAARAALSGNPSPAERARVAESAVRGLGLSVCWSPFFVSSAVASQLVPQVRAWELVAVGLGYAALGMLLSLALFYRDTTWSARLAAVRASCRLAVPAGCLVALVLAVSAATGLRGLHVIVLVIPLVCLSYLKFLGVAPLRRAVARMPANLGRLADELIIIPVALAFGALVAGAGVDSSLQALIAQLAETPFLVLPVEVLAIAIGGYVGVHPMITATTLIPLMAEANASLAPVTVAYAVVFGWALSSMAAIWTMPVSSAATMFGVPILRFALGRNLAFAAGFGLCGMLLLPVIDRLVS